MGTFLPSLFVVWVQEPKCFRAGVTVPARHLPSLVPAPGTCTHYVHIVHEGNVEAFAHPGRTTLLQTPESPDSVNCQTCRAFVCLQIAAGCRLQAGGQMDTWPGLQLGLKLLSWVWFPKNTADCLRFSQNALTSQLEHALSPFPPPLLYAAQRAVSGGEATARGDRIRSRGLGCLFARPSPAAQAYLCNLFPSPSRVPVNSDALDPTARTSA